MLSSNRIHGPTHSGKARHLLNMLYVTGADPGFFWGGGALVSCSTSTPINHIVFFFFCRIPVVLKNRRSSRGGAPPVSHCNIYHQFPRSPLGTPGTMIPLLVGTHKKRKRKHRVSLLQ